MVCNRADGSVDETVLGTPVILHKQRGQEIVLGTSIDCFDGPILSRTPFTLNDETRHEIVVRASIGFFGCPGSLVFCINVLRKRSCIEICQRKLLQFVDEFLRRQLVLGHQS